MTKRGSRLATVRGAPPRRTRRTAMTGALRFAGRTSTSTRCPPRGADTPGTRAVVVCAARTTRSNSKTRSFEKKRATPPRGGRARAPNEPQRRDRKTGASGSARKQPPSSSRSGTSSPNADARRRESRRGVLLLLLLLLPGKTVSKGTTETRAISTRSRKNRWREERRTGRVVFLPTSSNATRETADAPEIRPDSRPNDPSFPVSRRAAENARLCRLCVSPQL